MIKERIANLGNLKIRKKGTYLIALCLAIILCMGSLVGCAIGQQQLPAPIGAGNTSSQNPLSENAPAGGNNSTKSEEDAYLLALHSPQKDFSEYARGNGAYAGYHVANVVINTRNLPEGLDPHGFLASSSLSFNALLAERDQWLDEGLEAGWNVSDRENILSSPITLVYADESLSAPYITRLIPAGNPMFTNEMFANGRYAAFEFESGNDDRQMLWFYNLDEKQITMASTWLNQVVTQVDIAFEVDADFWGGFDSFVDNVSNKEAINIQINNLSASNYTDYDNLMALTQKSSIEGTNDMVQHCHLIDKRDGSVVFGISMAYTPPTDSTDSIRIPWSESFEQYTISTDEVAALAKSLTQMHEVANSLL